MLRNFNMVCILSDVNKIDPNLTFRSSRTPSVCQYKHQSLVFILFSSPSSLELGLQENTYFKRHTNLKLGMYSLTCNFSKNITDDVITHDNAIVNCCIVFK